MTRRASTLTRTDGFTLTEVMITVLIIGVLAAIVVPMFSAQRAKAQDANAKTMARSAATAMETYHAEQDLYDADAAALRQIAPELAGVQLSVTGGHSTYELRVRSQSGNAFTIGRAEADGPLVRTCNAAGQGGCDDHGAW